jgi:predicted neutral ceramidase superfamily lipid hydrolase
MGKVILSIVLSLCFYLLGSLKPSAVLLDVPFGFAYFIIDSLGLWRPGPIWVHEHRFLSLFCFLVWPLMLSMAFSYAAITIADKIWKRRSRHLHLYIVIFALVFALILTVRAEPSTIRGSYFGYWASNY